MKSATFRSGPENIAYALFSLPPLFLVLGYRKEREFYFKELARRIGEAGNSQIYKAGDRLETLERVYVAL